MPFHNGDRYLRRINQLLANLTHPKYGKIDVSEAITRFLHDLIGNDQLLQASVEWLDHLGAKVFIGSNRNRIDLTDSQIALRRDINEAFALHHAVHLEEGPWNHFPPDRVGKIVKAQGLADFITLDFEPSYRPDVVGDVQRLPFGDETIDRICSTSLYEHIAYPHDAIRESLRVLRPGGVLRVSTLFIYTLHGGSSPNDYLRYSPSFFRRICTEAGFKTVITDTDSTSGAFYNVHNILKATKVDETLPTSERLVVERLHFALLLLTACLTPYDKKFSGQARSLFKSIDVVAIKPGKFEPRRRRPRNSGTFLERNLDLLAAPGGGELILSDQALVHKKTGERFPIIDGIPIFVSEKDRI